MADLSVKEVAAELRVNPETVRRWLLGGQLRGYRPGGTKAGWRISASEVERLKRDGASAPPTDI